MWKILQKYNGSRTIFVATDAQVQTWAEAIMALVAGGGVIFAGLKMLWNKGKSKQKDDDEIKSLWKDNQALHSEIDGLNQDIEEIKLTNAKILGKLSILVPDNKDTN